MFKRVWYEWLLTVVFAAMVLLCVFLNLTPGHEESLANIIVNVAMFLIVGLMFLWADLKSFGPMNSIIRDLNSASEKIKKDAMNTHSYLWEPYQSGNVELFKDRELQEIFQDFLFELNRDNDAENLYYRPSIDDYINEDLIDRVTEPVCRSTYGSWYPRNIYRTVTRSRTFQYRNNGSDDREYRAFDERYQGCVPYIYLRYGIFACI